MELLESIYSWLMSLGDSYGVNPLIFGIIYVGAIPFFSLSVVWLIYNYKRGISIILPVLSSTFFFVSAYLYLLIAGKNVPWWVYLIVLLMIIIGGWFTIKKIRNKVTGQIDKI